MSKIGNTKLIKVGGAIYLLVPSAVAKDDRFPYKVGEELIIELNEKGMSVRK